MSDSIDIEAACAAARRYAQLIYYHDNFGRSQGFHPFWAWREFMRQFSAIPRGAVILSIISRSYAAELRRLVEERKAISNGKGKSPAPKASGHWHLV